MTKFSKSSLQRKGSTGNVRQLLIGVGVVASILGLINAVSSSSADEVVSNPKLSVGAEATIDLPKVGTKKENASPADTRDFAKIAKEVFNENPDDFNLRNSLVYNTDYHFDTNREIYHHYKQGLAGAVIEDILMCHAYAFHNNATYGGSCGDPDDLMAGHKELLASLGLKDRMPFACPRNHADKEDGVRRSTIPLGKCKEQNTRIWTPEYVTYLRSLVTIPTTKNEQHTIVVHIRRGSVTPCLRLQKDGFQRYLPNLHYLNVIEKYKKPDSKVLIFSQSYSYEDLKDFSEKGYEVSYEEDLSAIWHAFVTADVAVMSRSDFSMVPALVATGTVVYTPMWHPPVKGWEVVDNDIMEKTDAETSRLRESCSQWQQQKSNDITSRGDLSAARVAIPFKSMVQGIAWLEQWIERAILKKLASATESMFWMSLAP